MVTKSREESTGSKRGRVKVPKLKLKKETVKDLQDRDMKKIKGGLTSVVLQTGAYTSGSCSCICRSRSC